MSLHGQRYLTRRPSIRLLPLAYSAVEAHTLKLYLAIYRRLNIGSYLEHARDVTTTKLAIMLSPALSGSNDDGVRMPKSLHKCIGMLINHVIRVSFDARAN